MQLNKFISPLFRLVPILFFAAIFGFYQSANAQSGRRPKPTPTPQTTPTSTTKEEPPVDKKPTEKIESLLIAGEVQDHNLLPSSHYLKEALTACLDYIKLQQRYQPSITLRAAYGGKMKFNQAEEKAKKETDTYILWISFVMSTERLPSASVRYVEYADYTVLQPQSGKKLFIGRIDIKQIANYRRAQGIPTQRSSSERDEMEEIGRGIIERLVNGGWVKE